VPLVQTQNAEIRCGCDVFVIERLDCVVARADTTKKRELRI
jgi:hypothetical protein